MKIIMTTGTFDLLHHGHINLLKRAKSRGDFLVVGLNSDELISYKRPVNNYETRVSMLEAIRYVDLVVPINIQGDKLKYITELHVNEFIIGSDYIGYPDIPGIEALCPVVFLERTPNISTTQLKNQLYNTYVIDIDDTISVTTNRDFVNSEPIQVVIDKINELYDAGVYIILFTARGMRSTNNNPVAADEKYRQITETWLNAHGVKYHELIFGKRNADAYVDDKSMSIDEFIRRRIL